MVRRQYSTYIRTKDYPGTKRYGPDFEYYNLLEDPYQLRNRAGALRPGMFSKLQDRLAALKNCAAKKCRIAEDSSQEILTNSEDSIPGVSASLRMMIKLDTSRADIKDEALSLRGKGRA